ncbi:MAG: precorrin-6A/cobalt-precorrin-6A reductase, partial [Bacteroidales bacterium]|nr:precorrin-6A/cobalt-precorrin-6A reductase [Bacteroidales bacterium]
MDSKPILIFGGTTEGRRAVSVVQEAGKRYFYSTLTPLQEIVCDNGVRLVGNMDEDDMRQFCTDNDVGLIIDA